MVRLERRLISKQYDSQMLIHSGLRVIVLCLWISIPPLHVTRKAKSPA